MRVRIERVPHGEQRYDTIGDWEWDRQGLVVRVSILSDFRSEIAVVVHEVVEAVLCKQAGISTAQVDAFDMGPIGGKLDDPGASPKAPYHIQHLIATAIERVVVRVLDLNWYDHNDIVDTPSDDPNNKPGVIFDGEIE